jgi:hypothetical protein
MFYFALGGYSVKMLFNKYIEDFCFDIGLSISLLNDEDEIAYIFHY